MPPIKEKTKIGANSATDMCAIASNKMHPRASFREPRATERERAAKIGGTP
jgi:hypothetical protein